ncbi:MAG: hypothetical protein SVR94_01505 [Pseudomonadota bacterium]|nr:hypothetical protein [Pseudomonadota bacterium]
MIQCLLFHQFLALALSVQVLFILSFLESYLSISFIFPINFSSLMQPHQLPFELGTNLSLKKNKFISNSIDFDKKGTYPKHNSLLLGYRF